MLTGRGADIVEITEEPLGDGIVPRDEGARPTDHGREKSAEARGGMARRRPVASAAHSCPPDGYSLICTGISAVISSILPCCSTEIVSSSPRIQTWLKTLSRGSSSKPGWTSRR